MCVLAITVVYLQISIRTSYTYELGILLYVLKEYRLVR